MGKRLTKCAMVGAVLSALLTVGGCDDTPKEQVEAKTQAKAVWDKLLTSCGDSYFYAGSFFDGSGGLAKFQVHRDELAEYKKVMFNFVPVLITEAEHMNGLEYRSRITMVSALYRRRDGGKWDSWQNGPAYNAGARNVDDVLAAAGRDILGDTFEMGGGGAMALEIVKVKGEWLIARRSVDTSSALGLGVSGHYKLATFLAQPVPKYDCQKADIFVSPEVIAEQNRLAAEATRAADQAKVDADKRREDNRAAAAVQWTKAAEEKLIQRLVTDGKLDRDGPIVADILDTIEKCRHITNETVMEWVKHYDGGISPKSSWTPEEKECNYVHLYENNKTHLKFNIVTAFTRYLENNIATLDRHKYMYTDISGVNGVWSVSITNDIAMDDAPPWPSEEAAKIARDAHAAREVEAANAKAVQDAEIAKARALLALDYTHATTLNAAPFVVLTDAQWKTASELRATDKTPQDIMELATTLTKDGGIVLDKGTAFEPAMSFPNNLMSLAIVSSNNPRIKATTITVTSGPHNGKKGLILIKNYNDFMEKLRTDNAPK